MRYSFLRTVFNAAFWAAVGYGVYLQWSLIAAWHVILRAKIDAYTDVVFLVAGVALLILLNYIREATANTVTGAYVRATGKEALNYEKGNYSKNLIRSA